MIIEFWKTGENPITCYNSRKTTAVDKNRIRKRQTLKHHNLRAVTFITSSGEQQNYESVVQASEKTGLTRNQIYDIINGRLKNKTEYQIFKSQINN